MEYQLGTGSGWIQHFALTAGFGSDTKNSSRNGQRTISRSRRSCALHAMQVAHLSDALRAQVGNCSGSCAKAVFIDQGDNYTGDNNSSLFGLYCSGLTKTVILTEIATTPFGQKMASTLCVSPEVR